MNTSLPLEQRRALSHLESTYSSRNDSLKLSIVRGMILELEEKHPGIKAEAFAAGDSIPSLPFYRSLELTVEHRAHVENVKVHLRHSAFHAVP